MEHFDERIQDSHFWFHNRDILTENLEFQTMNSDERLPYMYLGRVRGSLVLNKTLEAIVGKKIRVLEEVDATDLNKQGNLIFSFDYIGAGENQLVLYEGGPESAYAFFPDKTGSDVNILAIVDSVDL